MGASLTFNNLISFSINTFSYLYSFSFCSLVYCLLLFFLRLAIGGSLCGGLAILNNKFYKLEYRCSFNLFDTKNVASSTLNHLNNRVMFQYNNSSTLTTPSTRLKLLHTPPWDLILPLHLPAPTVPQLPEFLLSSSCFLFFSNLPLLSVIEYELSSFIVSITYHMTLFFNMVLHILLGIPMILQQFFLLSSMHYILILLAKASILDNILN